MKGETRILVVEDDEAIREALIDFISEEGYSCCSANDGKHALDILAAGSYDPTLIILDLNMPRISGKEFLRERARLNLAPRARVVMLSATAAVSEIPEITAWIRKPVELDTLQKAIDTHGNQTA